MNFSVTNFRSITAAHKIDVSDKTILIGKNNEGKSNILKALDIAMFELQWHANAHKSASPRLPRSTRRNESSFFWERDFPMSLQSKKTNTHTVFTLVFRLDEDEILEFKEKIKSNLNGTLPIEIRVDSQNNPTIKVQKKGRGAKPLSAKSSRIAEFIAGKIVFNYIPAIRTNSDTLIIVERMLSQRLRQLEAKPEYKAALATIKDLQTPILLALGEKIKEPLVKFLPGIKSVKIEFTDDVSRSPFRNEFNIIIDDGSATSLTFKGDGVKSLAALGLLKDRIATDGASIVAIEEPESHLHPAAIHQLNEVITGLSLENQVILTTHNPLFVDRKHIKSNIIVDGGKATPAKSIAEIRELLGIKASDNLVNANLVLVVEGVSDSIILGALLPHLSEIIGKLLKSNFLIIEEIGGAGKLGYKLSLLRASLCTYYTVLDYDDAGRNAFDAAVKDELLSVKLNTFLTCRGSKDSELEDCLDSEVYARELKEKFSVDVNHAAFRGNKKWSVRLRDTFHAQGKHLDTGLEKKVKEVVAEAVRKNPGTALNNSKRGSIDALVTSLEQLVSAEFR